MHRLYLAAMILVLAGGAALAQDAILERLEADATVRVELGTTGRTVTAERVIIREVGALMTTVAEAVNVDGEVTFEDLKIFNFKPYIVSAWVDGVAYHVKPKGQTFLNGTTVVINAFEQTTDLAGLTVTGMNVVIRAREDEFEFEYIVTVANQSRPQRTISANALPIQLALPTGLRAIEVEVDNGPDPLTAELRSAGGGLTGVATALTPGEARITVRGAIPLAGEGEAANRIEFSVAANLAIANWSLLAWPASLEVRSFDLDLDRDNTYTEFSRWIGEPLEPGDEIDITVGVVAVTGEAAPVFSEQTEEAAASQTQRATEKRGVPWLTIISAMILLSAYVVWRRRR